MAPYCIMRYLILILATGLLMTGCRSTKMVSQWKSPDTPVFEANKVLVVGLTDDVNNRRLFETTLQQRLEAENVIAVRSVDFFESSFINNEQSEEDLDAIEQDLLDAGFDAILFSKILGVSQKVTLVQSFRDMDDSFDGFTQDYFESQKYYTKRSERQEYQLFHTQTNLYCICPDKERELLWSGKIDVVDGNLKRNINDFVQLLMQELENAQLLMVEY